MNYCMLILVLVPCFLAFHASLFYGGGFTKRKEGISMYKDIGCA